MFDLLDSTFAQPTPAVLFLSLPLVAISEFGLPISIFLESILLFSGYKISQGHLIYLFVTIFTIIGSLIGATILYLLSKSFGERILNRYKFFNEKRTEVEKRIKKYSRWESLAITLLRLTPGLYVPTTIASGILDINYWKFISGVFFSGVVYNLVFLTLGVVIGKNVRHLTPILSFDLNLALNILAIPVFLIFLIIYLRDGKNRH